MRLPDQVEEEVLAAHSSIFFLFARDGWKLVSCKTRNLHGKVGAVCLRICLIFDSCRSFTAFKLSHWVPAQGLTCILVLYC